MVRGNRHAHRNGTHHQHPPDHARRRQHPTSSQRQSKRTQPPSPTPQTRQSKKANGRRNSTTRASQTKPATKQTTNPQRKIPTNTIGNSSSHPATSWQPSTTRNSASAYPYVTEQANRRSPSAQGIGKAHPCQSGEREPIPSSPHTGASPTNSCSPNSTKPEKVTNSPSPPSAKPSPIKCKQSAPSPPTISPG